MSKILKGEAEGVKVFTLDPLLKRDRDKGLKEDVSTIREEAYRKGFEEGRREGLEAGRGEVEAILNRFSRILKDLEEARNDFYREKEKELVELVVAVARKVIGRELATRRELIGEMIRAAIESISHGGSVTVKVSPEDYSYLAGEGSDLLEGVEGIRIEADPSIEMGCLVECDHGGVDGRVDETLKRIEKAMKEAVERCG